MLIPLFFFFSEEELARQFGFRENILKAVVMFSSGVWQTLHQVKTFARIKKLIKKKLMKW